jgi:hypothetical protein
MLFTRVKEMRSKRIHPQAASTSTKMAARLENIQPADNFRNLFEVPVLFYALAAIALEAGAICNGQVKQDTFLSTLLIEFPLKFQRGLVA